VSIRVTDWQIWVEGRKAERSTYGAGTKFGALHDLKWHIARITGIVKK